MAYQHGGQPTGMLYMFVFFYQENYNKKSNSVCRYGLPDCPSSENLALWVAVVPLTRTLMFHNIVLRKSACHCEKICVIMMFTSKFKLEGVCVCVCVCALLVECFLQVCVCVCVCVCAGPCTDILRDSGSNQKKWLKPEKGPSPVWPR